MRMLVPALLAGALAALPAAGCSAQTSTPAAPRRSASTAPESADERAFGERVRAYLLRHPEVLQEALQTLDDQSKAEEAAATRAMIASHVSQLERDARDPVVGNPNGTKTLVEFFDYRCPYCKVADPALPDFLKAHPDVRLVFKEFPILSEGSEAAAKLALAAARQGKYWPVHQAFMQLPQLTGPAMMDVLRQNGVDAVRAQADADGPEIKRQLADVHALAVALGANGTPTFITGGVLSAGWLPDELEAALKAPTPTPAVAVRRG